MGKEIKNTERLIELSGYFGRRNALLTGRDTTGLMLLIEELTPENGRVLLPALDCMTRLASVLGTGRTPVIIDVDENLNMDPARLDEVAQKGDLVVPIHLFGFPFQIQKIQQICDDKGCILIEDASQAIGGKFDGAPIGSFGKASLLSFADRKILPTIGGGVVVTDAPDLYTRIQAIINELPERPSDYAEHKKELQNKSKTIFKSVLEGDREAGSQWYQLYDGQEDLLRFAIEPKEIDAIIDSIGKYDMVIKSRREMIYFLTKKINADKVKLLQYPIHSAPFRFSMILDQSLDLNQVNSLADELKSKGFDVARLYIPLHWLAPDAVVTNGCPKADSIGQRIINLRIDDTTTRAQANLAGDIINGFFN